jgi:hypothetical protein
MTVGEANAFRLRLSRESRPRRRGSVLRWRIDPSMPRPTVWAADQCATSRIRHMGGSKRSASASRRMRRCARTPAESNPKPQTPPFPSPSARRSSDPRMMFVFLRAKPLTEARCPSDKLGSSTAKGCGRAPSRKKPWAPKEPKCVDEEASPAFSHQIRGGHRVWNARQSPQRSRRDGRRAWPCR